ncbi:MAG: hypothetical protein SF187_12510 [Deltaproteobacteria bacterium]|nr:hypothetical protein [Deltaproteobacteria bacterium]
MQTQTPSLFERAGGEPVVRPVIRDFVAQMYRDIMIGFFFRGIDEAHLVEREYEFTARFLGAQAVSYGGQPIKAAHSRHLINDGQFARRRQILLEAMIKHGVPEDVRAAWLAHVDEFKAVVVQGQCQ